MKNINELELQNIELTELCTKNQAEYYLADVNNLYNETSHRIWGYIEVATANHQIKEIKKYIKVAEELTKIKESIWSVESVILKYGQINFFPQYKVLKQQHIKINNI